MEKNVVILPVEDYNDLRDFRTKIEEGAFLSSSGYSTTRFMTVTKDNVIERLTNDNEILVGQKKHDDRRIGQLKDEIYRYKEKFGELNNDNNSKHELDINQKIKEMTIWDFVRLKFKRN